MHNSAQYRFSFTAASLMQSELAGYAVLLVESGFDMSLLTPTHLNKEKEKTGQRKYAELKLRLSALSNEELTLLSQADSVTQKQIAYLAFCRVYAYFRDFIQEVVVDKTSLYDFQITDRDYNAFFNKKCVDHNELDTLTDSSKYKIKQVLFKVMEQAGIIDSVKTKNIIVPILSAQLERMIKHSNPKELSLFLTPQPA
jgi:hypothetical protein